MGKPLYRVREVTNGLGVSSFNVEIRWGLFWPFTYFYEHVISYDTLLKANNYAINKLREIEHNRKKDEERKVKVYSVNTIPSHIPKAQSEKYLKRIGRQDD
jgi:hypothetical protein